MSYEFKHDVQIHLFPNFMKLRKLSPLRISMPYSESATTFAFTLVGCSSSVLLRSSYQGTLATGKKSANYVPIKYGTQHFENWKRRFQKRKTSNACTTLLCIGATFVTCDNSVRFKVNFIL